MNKSILTLVIVLTICAMLLPGQPAAAQVPEAAAADAGLTATVTDLFGYATAVTPYNWVEIFDAGAPNNGRSLELTTTPSLAKRSICLLAVFGFTKIYIRRSIFAATGILLSMTRWTV